MPRPRIVFTVAIGLLATLCPAQGGDGALTLEDLKCQACDYAVRAWVRHAALADTECRRLGQGQVTDADVERILPARVDGTVDVARDCEAGGSGVSNEGVDHVAEALCKELFLDEFPFVEEFPADGNVETDRLRQWESPPGYFDRKPHEDGIEPLSAANLDLIRKSCEHTMPVGNARRRTKEVAMIRKLIEDTDLANIADKLAEQKASELASVLDAAEQDARLLATPATSSEADDNDAGAAALIAEKQAEARAQFLTQAKRQAIYDVILKMQKTVCSKACPADISRPVFDTRVWGWSASLKRL